MAELDALVKRHAAHGSHLHRGLAVARVLERGRSRVVVDEVPDALPRVPDLPAFRKGLLVLQAGRRSGGHRVDAPGTRPCGPRFT